MLVMILNPTAGNGLAEKEEQALLAELDRRGLEWKALRTERPGHAGELAREAAAYADTVVAVGGDGTASEVAGGLMGTGVPMGIIPAGTGNDFVKTAGIPTEPLAALRHLLEKPARPIDICTINGRAFLNVCGTGFDVQVLDCAEKFKARMKGLLPYMLGLLQAIASYRPVHLRCRIDGGETKELDALICAVANGQYIGGGIPICPGAKPDDGRLELVLLRHRPRYLLPFCVPGLMLKRVLNFKITTHLLCTRVEMEGERMRVQVDGEISGMDRADVLVHPGQLLLHW